MRSSYVLLALIVIVSGCISGFPGFGTSSGAGVSINSLSFSPSSVKSDQLTKMSLSIQNNGDFAIENDDGFVYIFGLPTGTNDWQIDDKSDMTSYSDTFSLAGIQNRGGKIYPGETKNFEWVLRAPVNLPQDEVFSYSSQARICYPYKTTAWGKLEVVSESEQLNNPPKEHSIQTQKTKGPINVEFISTQPLTVQDNQVKIKVRITNTGDGSVTANDCSLFGNSAAGSSTNAIENLNKITLEDSDCTLQDDIYLQKGQSRDTYILCDAPQLGNNPTVTGDFSMNLTYNYYSDKTASVSVTGTSEAAARGVGVGGGAATVALTDPCTKFCDAAGQKPTGSDARGICRPEKDSPAFDYPPGNTFGFQLLLDPLGWDTLNNKLLSIDKNAFSSIYSGNADSVTIKDLKLHDARLGDFSPEDITQGTSKPKDDGTIRTNGLLELAIGDIDSGAFSKQYPQQMLDADTDNDGLPDWFEEKYTPPLNADKKDANGNKVNDPDEIYSGTTTYMQQYLKENSTVYRSLGIANYICRNYPIGKVVGKNDAGGSVTMPSPRPTTDYDSAMKDCRETVNKTKLINLAGISFNGKEYNPSSDAEALRNLQVDSLQITAIDGFAISDIALSNPSRKIRSKISNINIADIYIKSVPQFGTSENLQNFLKYSKCTNANSPPQYSRGVICRCLKDGSPRLESWVISSDSPQCDATCKNTLKIAGGGACSPSGYNKNTVCKNSKVVQIRQFDNGAGTMGCTAPDRCVCIEKTLATLSSQDVPIVCGGTGIAAPKSTTAATISTSTTITQDKTPITPAKEAVTPPITEQKPTTPSTTVTPTIPTPLKPQMPQPTTCVAKTKSGWLFGGCGNNEEECTGGECGIISWDEVCCKPAKLAEIIPTPTPSPTPTPTPTPTVTPTATATPEKTTFPSGQKCGLKLVSTNPAGRDYGIEYQLGINNKESDYYIDISANFYLPVTCASKWFGSCDKYEPACSTSECTPNFLKACCTQAATIPTGLRDIQISIMENIGTEFAPSIHAIGSLDTYGLVLKPSDDYIRKTLIMAQNPLSKENALYIRYDGKDIQIDELKLNELGICNP